MALQGCKLEVVSSYEQDGEIRIASLFLKENDTGTDWYSKHDLAGVQAGLEFGTASLLGYSLKYASAGTIENGEPRFAAVYTKEGTQLGRVVRPPTAMMDLENIERLMGSMTKYLGYMPAVIDAYKNENGRLRWLFVLVDAMIDEVPEPEPNGDTFTETDCFDDIVTAFMKDNNIPGVSAAVLKEGKVVYSQGYGM